MVTCEIRDNKLYTLLFSEYAEWLINNTYSKVLFCSHSNPSFEVNKDNFDWCNKLHLESRKNSESGNDFILEQELPNLEVKSTSSGYKLNSNPNGRLHFFLSYSFEDLEVWKSREVDTRYDRLPFHPENLDKVRLEVEDIVSKLPIIKLG